MIWLGIALGVVGLVLVAALVAAAEAALGVLSRAELEELADESRRPGGLRRIADDAEAHASALSFARLGLETIAAVLVALAFARTFERDWVAFAVAVGVMLVVGFVLIGSSPRSIGRARPRGTVKALAGLVRGVRLSIGPVADLLVSIGDTITPGRPARSDSVTSEEQLLSLVDEAAELEVLDEDDRELIHSVFAFGDRYVREVMVARTDMISVDAERTVREAIRELLDAGMSRAPVIGRDGDDVRGIVYQKDLAKALLVSGVDGDLPVAGFVRPAEFVPESMAADALLRRMRRESTHFAIVVDEYGGVAGLATIEDLIEELVGDISDEYDRNADAVELLDDGALRVPSRTPTGELGEFFDIELEYDDVDSVGGLLAKELGKIPEAGDSVVTNGLELVAERVGRRGRITTVRVRPVSEGADGEDGLDAPLVDSLEHALDDRRAPRR
ncbi:MAG: HlyC/CorC family transporter [Microbacteriaceae bacterium]|nr:HlyC/CorC family transporter [Microbacteriaceae bacterium]